MTTLSIKYRLCSVLSLPISHTFTLQREFQTFPMLFARCSFSLTQYVWRSCDVQLRPPCAQLSEVDQVDLLMKITKPAKSCLCASYLRGVQSEESCLEVILFCSAGKSGCEADSSTWSCFLTLHATFLLQRGSEKDLMLFAARSFLQKNPALF